MQSAIERWDELKLKLYEFEGYAIRPCWFMYNQFIELLKLELCPSQFIPWDNENNRPLEKPHLYDEWLKNGHYPSEFNDSCKQYQQAKSEVIFEGFEVEFEEEIKGKKWIYIRVPVYGRIVAFFNGKLYKAALGQTIEDIHKHVELNKNGKKLGGYETNNKIK